MVTSRSLWTALGLAAVLGTAWTLGGRRVVAQADGGLVVVPLPSSSDQPQRFVVVQGATWNVYEVGHVPGMNAEHGYVRLVPTTVAAAKQQAADIERQAGQSVSGTQGGNGAAPAAPGDQGRAGAAPGGAESGPANGR